MLSKNQKLKIKNQKLGVGDSTGFAAMFTFTVMLMIMSILVAVFSAIALKSLGRVRLNQITLKNIYANEGFVEDTLRRVKESGIANPTEGETLTVADVSVVLAITTEATFQKYTYSANYQDKYFHKLELGVSTSSPPQVKSWKDSL